MACDGFIKLDRVWFAGCSGMDSVALNHPCVSWLLLMIVCVLDVIMTIGRICGLIGLDV